MLNRKVLLALICFLSLGRVNSQTPSYYHYTSTDGLASSTVYGLIQDKNGLVWFATSNGMSNFDGIHFTTLRIHDGLNSNSIISLVEGKNGEIYIGNYEKGINVLRDGHIENYCKKIKGKNFATSYLLLDTLEHGGQKLYAYRSWGSINIFHEKIGDKRSDYTLPMNQHVVKLEQLKNGQMVALTTEGLSEFIGDSLKKLNISGLPEMPIYCLSKGNDDDYYLGTRGAIYRIIKGSVVQRFKIDLDGNNDVVSVLTDKNGNIWFSIMNRGFYLIPKSSENFIDIGSKMKLQNTLVNNFLEDTEGNIWVSTFGKGVYCLNNLYLKNFNENDGLSNNNIYSMVKERTGKLIIGTFNGINIFDNGKFSPLNSNTRKTLTENINNISNINGQIYVCGAFGGSDIINLNDKGIKFHLLVYSAFCRTSDGDYLFGNWDNSISVCHDINHINSELSKKYIFGDRTNVNRINFIFEDSQKNVWIGTGLGLCKLTPNTGKSGLKDWNKRLFPSDPVLNSKITSIYQDSHNRVWITSEKGIGVYDPNKDSIKTITSLKGFDFSSSTSIASDNKMRIWVGNMKGLYLIDNESVKFMNTQTGLPSDEVFSLCYDKKNDELNIGTSNGMSVLNVKLFDSYRNPPPKVKITKFAVGDSVFMDPNYLILKPDQNHIVISFKALSYSSPGSVRYKYVLNGDSTETDLDFLDFRSLDHGSYKLTIVAKCQNSVWGKPCNINFEIKPWYYETYWFRLGMLLLSVLISILFISWRWELQNQKIRNELELSERINELKHQALSAMMNPHFIFNALNSVQYLINSKRNEEANDYVSMMARLIRKNLDTAGNGFILISEEVARLKLYLDLEKLRFQESFTYEVFTGDGIDPGSVQLPNMIVQPFVENTLWHGIINSGNTGKVTISFTFEDINVDSVISKSLIIKISDNGIGINEARKHKAEDHISKGIQIIEERLKLLSTKMDLPKPIMLEDLSNRNSNSHGTEVIISLPPQLYKIGN
ncbi:MAG: two-component regulator propeller domain-containing protein [Mariniphaga sp.]